MMILFPLSRESPVLIFFFLFRVIFNKDIFCAVYILVLVSIMLVVQSKHCINTFVKFSFSFFFCHYFYTNRILLKNILSVCLLVSPAGQPWWAGSPDQKRAGRTTANGRPDCSGKGHEWMDWLDELPGLNWWTNWWRTTFEYMKEYWLLNIEYQGPEYWFISFRSTVFRFFDD